MIKDKNVKKIYRELELLFDYDVDNLVATSKTTSTKTSSVKLSTNTATKNAHNVDLIVNEIITTVYFRCSDLAKKNYGNVIDYKKIVRFVREEMHTDAVPLIYISKIEARVVESLKQDGIIINNLEVKKENAVIDVKTFIKSSTISKNKAFKSTDKKLRLEAKQHFDVRGKLSNHVISNKLMISDASPFLLNIIGSKSVLKFSDEKRLISMLNSKNKVIYKIASDRLVNCNLRLIYSIANKYKNRGIEMTDLFNEGLTGLYRAISKFDSNKFSNRFSTYATWWIRQAITRAISEQGRLIRLPVHMVDSINLIFRKERELTFTNARSPKTEEIVNEIITTKTQIFTERFFEKMEFNYKSANKQKINKIRRCLTLTRTPNKSHIVIAVNPTKAVALAEQGYTIPLPIKFKIYKIFEVEKLRQQAQDIINLERPINSDNDDSTIADFVEDMVVQKPSDAFGEGYIKNYVYRVINTQITDIKDQKILRMRLGLRPYNEVHSVDKISELSHLSRENVRKSFNNSIEILSHPHNKKKLTHLWTFLAKK